MNKLSSEWAIIFSGHRSGTTTTLLRTQTKWWNQSTISTTMSFQTENTPYGDNIMFSLPQHKWDQRWHKLGADK
jgi:hypothetical protein